MSHARRTQDIACRAARAHLCMSPMYLKRFKCRQRTWGSSLTFMHFCASCKQPQASQLNLSSAFSVSVELQAEERASVWAAALHVAACGCHTLHGHWSHGQENALHVGPGVQLWQALHSTACGQQQCICLPKVKNQQQSGELQALHASANEKPGLCTNACLR